MGVIDLQIVPQTGFKVLSGTEVTTFQKATRQDTQPQLHLVEPRAMFGGEVEHMLMAWIAEEGPSLHASAQVLGHQGHLAPLGHQTAQVEAPVGIEIIHHPVVPVHLGQLGDHMAQMGDKISAGARLAQVPQDLTRGHHKGGNQCPCPMTDVLVLAFFRFAWRNGLRGVFALQNLHAGLFIAANDETALLKEPLGIEI